MQKPVWLLNVLSIAALFPLPAFAITCGEFEQDYQSLTAVKFMKVVTVPGSPIAGFSFKTFCKDGPEDGNPTEGLRFTDLGVPGAALVGKATFDSITNTDDITGQVRAQASWVLEKKATPLSTGERFKITLNWDERSVADPRYGKSLLQFNASIERYQRGATQQGAWKKVSTAPLLIHPEASIMNFNNRPLKLHTPRIVTEKKAIAFMQREAREFVPADGSIKISNCKLHPRAIEGFRDGSCLANYEILFLGGVFTPVESQVNFRFYQDGDLLELMGIKENE